MSDDSNDGITLGKVFDEIISIKNEISDLNAEVASLKAEVKTLRENNDKLHSLLRYIIYVLLAMIGAVLGLSIPHP